MKLGPRAAATLAVSAAGVALGVVANLVLARSLGTRGYGAYSWALVVVSGLAVAAAAGLDVLIIREAAVLNSRRAEPLLRGTWRTAQQMSLIAGAMLALATVVIALAAHDALPGGLLGPLLVGAPALPLIALGLLQQGLAQGLHRPLAGLLAWSVLRQVILLTAVLVALEAGSLAPAGAMVLALLATALTAAVGAFTLRRLLGRGAATPPPSGWTRQARPMALANVVTVFDAQLGLIALGVLNGPRSAGLFAAATQATVGFVLVRNAGFRPLAPLMAVMHDIGDSARLQALLTRATRWVAAITLAGAIALIAAAHPLLSLFGPGFGGAAHVLALLAIAHVVNAFVAFNGTVLNVAGYQSQTARAAATALLVHAGALSLLVPLVGVDGAGIAALVDVTVRNILCSHAVRAELGLTTAALAPPRWLQRKRVATRAQV